MNNFKKTVALISGGEGHEHDISILSAKNLYALIDRSRYDVLDVFIDKDGAWSIREDGRLTPTFPTRLGEARGFIYGSRIMGVAAAIPCLHGDFGEDGYVQGALRLAGIPFVGQDVYASALTQDKIYTKFVARSLGIPTADFIFLDILKYLFEEVSCIVSVEQGFIPLDNVDKSLASRHMTGRKCGYFVISHVDRLKG